MRKSQNPPGTHCPANIAWIIVARLQRQIHHHPEKRSPYPQSKFEARTSQIPPCVPELPMLTNDPKLPQRTKFAELSISSRKFSLRWAPANLSVLHPQSS